MFRRNSQSGFACRLVAGLPLFLAGLAASQLVAAEPAVIRSLSGIGRRFKANRLRPSYRRYGGEAGTVVPGDARPLSLATADLNGDGYPDLVAGYATSAGGMIAVHFANPEAFAPSSPESLAGAARGEFQPSFGASALTIPVDEAPSLLAVGDFNQDGQADILFAATGRSRLFILAGDGHGGFASPVSIAVPGVVTAMGCGTPERR